MNRNVRLARRDRHLSVGLIGMGSRGSVLLQNLWQIPGVAVRAICDIDSEQLEHGPRPIGCEVLNYPDPDPANCRVENLRWAPIGSSKLGRDPLLDRHSAQRFERNLRPRLNTELVVWARAEYAAGRRTTELATELGVSETTNLLAVPGKTWGHVPGAVTRPPQPTRGAEVNTSRLVRLGSARDPPQGQRGPLAMIAGPRVRRHSNRHPADRPAQELGSPT